MEEKYLWDTLINENWNRVFHVQSEIAQGVAAEINAAVSPEEKKIIEMVPTSDLKAYDYYLIGNNFVQRGLSEANNRYAIQMYKKAIEIDSSYALAWVGLAARSRASFWFGYDISKENLSLTKKYLDRAISLLPNLKEVRIEQARYYYHCEHDYQKSLILLEKLKAEYQT